MDQVKNLQKFKNFLNIYGVLILIVMGVNSTGFLFQIIEFNPGGKFHWLIWDDIGGHVGPMIFVVYMVWAIFLLKAAKDPLSNLTFLDFTMWANIAHGLLMIPMAFNDSMYHSKFLTDIPFLLSLSLGIYLLRPQVSVKELKTN